MRVHSIVLLGCLAAGLGLAQATDPHENPVIQNAPAGKKATETAVPPESKALPVERSRTAPTPPPASIARAPDPADPEEIMLGAWILVPSRSTFQPGPPPKSETRRYARGPAGIVATISRVEQDGSKTEISYPWVVDGSEHQITGSDVVDMIQLKQIDNLTAEATLRHAGKVLATERRSISADGRSMTIVFADMTSEEKPVSISAIYEKTNP